jgi:hypothetical protein
MHKDCTVAVTLHPALLSRSDCSKEWLKNIPAVWNLGKPREELAFFNACLFSQKFPAEVTYCSTDSEGFVIRFDFTVNVTSYAPLIDSLREGLPPDLRALRPQWMLSDSDVDCYEDHSQVTTTAHKPTHRRDS